MRGNHPSLPLFHASPPWVWGRWVSKTVAAEWQGPVARPCRPPSQALQPMQGRGIDHFGRTWNARWGPLAGKSIRR